MIVPAFAAQESPLLGLTRDEVLARYGEPRSVMASSGREILFFARERIVLRNGVVIEVEPLPAEPPPRRATPPAATTAAQPQQSTDGAAATSGAENPAGNASAANTAQPPAASGTSPASAPAASETAAPRTAEPTPPREPEIAIKLVRPPSGTYTRPAPKQAEPSEARPVADPKPAASTPAGTASAPAPAPVTPAAPAIVEQPVIPTPTPTAAPAESSASTVAPQAETATAAPTETAAQPQPAAAPPAPSDKPDVAQPTPATPSPAKPEPASRTTPIIIGAIVLALGFLFWRRRQRQLALAATAVSREPLSDGPAAAAPVVQFTTAHLAKLNWKHFEELVAAYYGKTGVVAERTKAGPASPVHIKISWKGESRPFALVHCIAHAVAPVGVKPLQDLVTVLGAEDIRRGYVVTSGHFAPEAREFAEEKHLTLLNGDAFLEKLNALPNSARAEVMNEVMQGDTSTPVCPKCEARMVRSPGGPLVYRCPAHADVTLPAR